MPLPWTYSSPVVCACDPILIFWAFTASREGMDVPFLAMSAWVASK